jgi:hypothetical protein
MRSAVLAACFALTFAAFPQVAAAQADHHANSPKSEFHLSQPLTVGTTTLTVGDYKFQCLRIDGADFLVVTSADDGKEVARVPCKPEDLVAKVRMSDLRTVPDGRGGRALVAVRIRGEMVAHRVVSN